MSQTRAMTVEAEARPRRKLRDRAEAEPTITRPSRGRGTWFKTEAAGCRGRAETEQAPRWWRNRAITMHRPFDTCWLRNWHRQWLVVWSCQDRLLQCCAPQRSQLQHQEVAASTEQRSSDRSRSTKTIPRIARWWGRYTGCPFSRGSCIKWLCWHSKFAAPRRRRTCDS